MLPFSIGGHAGMQGAFHIMELAGEDESVLFLETGYGHVRADRSDRGGAYRARLAAMLTRPCAAIRPSTGSGRSLAQLS